MNWSTWVLLACPPPAGAPWSAASVTMTPVATLATNRARMSPALNLRNLTNRGLNRRNGAWVLA